MASVLWLSGSQNPAVRANRMSETRCGSVSVGALQPARVSAKLRAFCQPEMIRVFVAKRIFSSNGMVMFKTKHDPGLSVSDTPRTTFSSAPQSALTMNGRSGTQYVG